MQEAVSGPEKRLKAAVSLVNTTSPTCPASPSRFIRTLDSDRKDGIAWHAGVEAGTPVRGASAGCGRALSHNLRGQAQVEVAEPARVQLKSVSYSLLGRDGATRGSRSVARTARSTKARVVVAVVRVVRCPVIRESSPAESVPELAGISEGGDI